jgi:hypothetical protein
MAASTTEARLPLLIGKVAFNVARERISTPRVRTLDDTPAAPEGVTDEWLTAALCRDVPDAVVTGHELAGGSDGTSSRRALRVGYNDAGRAAELPERLFLKMAASLQSRLFLVLSGVTEGESMFYRDIRPLLPGLRSPRAYHAATDPRTVRSVLLMDDLAAAGWQFPDPMHAELSRQDLEDMVDQMAYYHGTFWDDRRLMGEFAALATSVRFQEKLNAIGIEKRAMVGVERAQSVLPESVYARKRELMSATMRALTLNSSGPLTLLHQDVHQGNWLRDPDGRMGLYDWQAVAKGEWALDFSYSLAVNLPVEQRREWERELLERYLWRLGEEGVGAGVPSFEQAWLRYRQQPFHVLIFALLTVGAGRFQPDMQPRDYMFRCLQRIGAFVEDHESLDSLA